MHSVEALNPLHASAGIFRQIEDVYLAVGEDYLVQMAVWRKQ